jgi:hypothetical protein
MKPAGPHETCGTSSTSKKTYRNLMQHNPLPGKRVNTLPTDTLKALAHLEALCQSGFWGAVKVKFENGRATHIVQEESFLPVNLTESPNYPNVSRNN